MGRLWRRLLEIEGDATRQLVDLLLFLGYFGICLLAGGAAYRSEYFAAFSLRPDTSLEGTQLAALFVEKVLVGSWLWAPAAVYLLAFVFLYYCARYLWRPWFGYFVLSGIFYATILSCVALGGQRARSEARRDLLSETAQTPVIKLYGKNDSLEQFESGSHRMLNEDEGYYYVYEAPEVAGSVVVVHTVRKIDVERVEVTVP